jgi:diguanylate cyclase (GGDEF)-like protein/PAS domain S-box-containing protein
MNLFENMYDGVYFIDRERRITYWNKAAEKITGFTSDEVLGKQCSDNILIHIDDKGTSICKGMCPLAATIKDGSTREAEVYLHHKKGHRVPVWIRATPLRDENNNIIGGAELFTDSSSQHLMLQRIKDLEELALIDTLTQLSNRKHLESEMHNSLQEMERYNLSFAILFIDIDNFKRFNDTYGHDVGDQILQVLAQTLKSAARPFDLFGRWGGEEFIGIIRNVDHDALVTIGNRCRILVEKSYMTFNDTFINVSISLGGTLAKKGDSIESILKRADHLMYESKKRGRNCLITDYTITSSSMP